MQPDLMRFLERTPWLMEPGRMQLLIAQAQRMQGWPAAREVAEERRRRLDLAKQTATQSIRAVKGQVGVIPIFGPVEQRLSCAGMMLGGSSTEEVGQTLDAMLADKSIEAVVLQIDSPGGSSYGTEELSDKIHAARGKKPLYAIADSMAASAAYWIASAAGQVLCTPGGDVGSVGVYCVHVDQSKMLEEDGVAVTFIHAGKYKVEGNPYAPLEAEARAHVQGQVDLTYGKFLDALKRNRGVTRDEILKRYGQGRVLSADQALEAGMIDRIMTFEQLLDKLTGGAGSVRTRQASVDVLKRRHALAKQRIQ